MWIVKIYSILLFLSVDLLSICSCNGFVVAKTRTEKRDNNSPDIDYSHQQDETVTSTNSMYCNISSISLNERSVDHSYDNSSEDTSDEVDISKLSEHFLNCGAYIIIEPGCYKKFGNDSIHVPRYKTLFDTANYVIRDDALYLCSDIIEKPSDKNYRLKFSSTMNTTFIVCVSISTACIILHIIKFTLIENKRNVPGYCLLSLCCALLITYTCAFVQYSVNGNVDCSVLGVISFYSLLSSLFWMNVFSFDVWKAIRLATTKLRLSATRHVFVRLATYSLYGWGTPLLIVIIAIAVSYNTTDERYKLTFDENTCWFKNKHALAVYFSAPYFVVLSLNFIFFVFSFYMINKATLNKCDSGSNSDLRSQLFLALRLASAMGLGWMFGVLATVTQQEWLFFLYAVCNALQGVFIFFSFTVNNKTIKACKAFIRKKSSSIVPESTIKESGHTQYNTQ